MNTITVTHPGNCLEHYHSRMKNISSNFEINIDHADNVAAVLFGKTRQVVLSLLLEQPEKSWYLRELARQTGISPGALQKELTQLHGADLLHRTEDGNRVLYRANTQHPVFSELQSLVRKTCGLPAQIQRALLPLAASIRYLAIYGSIAKGTQHARSDIDLLLVGTLPFEQAVGAIAAVEERLGREISIRLFSQEEFRQRRDSADGFVMGILDGERIDLIGSIDDA
jgi:predicted nucleotidyltransferase